MRHREKHLIHYECRRGGFLYFKPESKETHR